MEKYKYDENIKKYFKEYLNFIQILSSKIIIAKEKNYEKGLTQNIINNQELPTSFLFFSYIKQFFIGKYSEDNNIENKSNILVFNFFEESINNYKFNLLCYWHHYLIISFIDELKKFLVLYNDNINIKNISSSALNKIISFFHQNNNIIQALYKQKKININQLISLLNIYILWIKDGYNLIDLAKIAYDKFYKLKNYYLYQIYFDLMKNIFLIELKTNDENNNIKYLFEHLNEINIYKPDFNINNIILLNNNFFHSFISSTLFNMDKILYSKYSKNLIQFYKSIISKNFELSKLLEKMIDNIKNSFLNLSLIKNDDNTIFEKNIIIQNFHCELLKDLLEENNENIKFFNYNGIDSKMSYKLGKSPLSNYIFIFSFKFINQHNSDNKKYLYPLLTFYNESKNINVFNLYIKFKRKKNKFFIYKKEGKEKSLLMEDMNIEIGKLYYIALYFEEKNIYIYLNNKSQIYENNSRNLFDIIQIGYNKKRKNYFSGEIGPFFMLKNNGCDNITQVIGQILNLRDAYPDFIYIINKETSYEFSCMNMFKYYFNTDKELLDIDIQNQLKDNKIKSNLCCLLCLTPFIIKCYSENDKEGFDKYYLPDIPYICEKEKYYNIYELNTSLIESENTQTKFLTNNGLYYICLQFEYYFQLSSIIINNGIKLKFKDEINDMIDNILNNTLIILNKYNNNVLNFYKEFKAIFLNLLNCLKNFCFLTQKHFSDKLIKNFGTLIIGIIDNIEYKRQNIKKLNIEENDIMKLVTLRDSLIDFLFTAEFYKNSDIKMIQFIFSLLLPISKKESDKIFLTNKNLIWKILRFVQLLENSITKVKEYNNEKLDNFNSFNIEISTKLFSLLKTYFICIKSEPYHKDIFSKFFHYFLKTYRHKYIIIYNFLNLIHYIITKEYYLEKYQIKNLIEYAYELIDNGNQELLIENENNIINDKNDNLIIEDKDKEIKNSIILIIILIFLDSIHLNKYMKDMKQILEKLLYSLEITIDITKTINKELDKIFGFLININNNNKEINSDFILYFNNINNIDIPKLFYRICNYVFLLLKTINESKNIYKSSNGTIKTELNNEMMSLLISLSIKIIEEFKKENQTETLYFILQYYIKFLNKIVFSKLFIDFSLYESEMFFFNLSEINQLCIDEYILNTNVITKVKIDGKYYEKTFLEAIIDINMSILFNNKFLKSNKLILESLKKIICLSQTKNTIFYQNDVLFYGKKQEKDEKIRLINNIFSKKNKSKFKMSFVIFALLKFNSYYYYFNDNIIGLNNNLKDFLESILNKLIKESFDLYKSNNDIFLKLSKSKYYTNLNKELQSYIRYINQEKIKKDNIFGFFSKFVQDKIYNIYTTPNEISSGNCNLEKNKIKLDNNININKRDNRIYSFAGNLNSLKKIQEKNNFNSNINISHSTNLNTVDDTNIILSSKNIIINDIDNIDMNDNEDQKENNLNIIEENIIDDDKDIKKFIIDEYIDENFDNDINLQELTKITYFLEDIDNYYISNIKKDIMNNIFSLYFIDIFYSNELFKKMKIIYFNEYPKAESDTKKLNYPSKYKKFSNGLEPDILLKLNYKFFLDKYFPISHPYFYDYFLNGKIPLPKYLKLFPKKIDLSKNKSTTEIDCELIKMDKCYFGKIYCYLLDDENKGFIVFQEIKYKFEKENESIFDNEENGKYIFSSSFLSHKLNKSKINPEYQNKFKRMNKNVIIHLRDIDEIIEKRFLLMWQGVEIYLKNGKSYFFNLLSENNKELLFDLFKNNSYIKNILHKKEFFSKEKQISKIWKNGGLSNYDYLLLLNKYGSRSFNDNSQYPVFPWLLLTNYEKIGIMNKINNEEENIDNIELLSSSIRKLKYPVCIQDEEKKENTIDKFSEEDQEYPYHLGIHYSTSSYIFYYLMRQQPFSNLMIKLQNYQQENPNRMFLGLIDSITTLQISKDSRELIPEFFCYFEFLLNLNCNYFGFKYNKNIVDDNLILAKDINFEINTIYKNNKEHKENIFFKFIYFIIEHKKLLNSKIISKYINDWIDNIFGIGQYPSSAKVRKNCCNIYIKSCYEHLFNLRKIYLNCIEKANNNAISKKMLLKRFLVDINLSMNFGQVPYQIFKEKHYKKEFNDKILKDIDLNETNIDIENSDGFEAQIRNFKKYNKIAHLKKNYYYNYFHINPCLNKIFVINEHGYIEILNSNIYTSSSLKNDDLVNGIFPLINIQLYFLLGEKIETNIGYSYFLYNIKYVFDSFDKENEDTNQDTINSYFKIYSRTLIEKLTESKIKQEEDKDKGKNKENKYFKIISCRYVDKSFKIHQIPMEKNKKVLKTEPVSYVCEDFVTSCRVISPYQFLIGLKNGKLIQCSINKNLKIEKYIQCHHGKINIIEIYKRLGLIITSGDDNYIFIRKLYDFELLTPIKIKDIYIITYVKISSFNFLYFICFDKIKNTSVIFGYTLSGIKFAKSDYGFYENFDFTNNGNLVTLKNRKILCILSGSNLEPIKTNDSFDKICNKIKKPIYLNYNYYLIKEEDEKYSYNKVITYLNEENNLIPIDVSDNCFFN